MKRSVYYYIIVSFFFGFVGYSQNPVNKAAQSLGPADENYKDYWGNGNLRLKYTKKNGNLEGEYLTYFKSGILESHTLFDQGHFHGMCTRYNKRSQLLKEGSFIHDTILEGHDVL